MTDLIFPVKKEYFDAIKSGEKTEEYRLYNDYWRKRIERQDREYEHVVITLGYPKKDDKEKRMVFPYLGYAVDLITHKHFGTEPVYVFSIPLAKRLK